MNRRSLLKGFAKAVVAFHAAPVLEAIAMIEAPFVAGAAPIMTARTFNELLELYLPTELLRQELARNDYFLSRINKGDNWQGGMLTIPIVSHR